jgi:hypothetical protein
MGTRKSSRISVPPRRHRRHAVVVVFGHGRIDISGTGGLLHSLDWPRKLGRPRGRVRTYAHWFLIPHTAIHATPGQVVLYVLYNRQSIGHFSFTPANVCLCVRVMTLRTRKRVSCRIAVAVSSIDRDSLDHQTTLAFAREWNENLHHQPLPNNYTWYACNSTR